MHIVPEVIKAIYKELEENHYSSSSPPTDMFTLLDTGRGQWTIIYRVTRGKVEGYFTHYRTVTFDRDGNVVGSAEESIEGYLKAIEEAM